MFNPIRMIRAAFDRSHLLGAVDASPADSRFIAASALPDDPDTLIEAGIVQPWRTSSDGERWFRAVDASALESWSPHTCPVAADDDDPGDFDPADDPYDVDDPADDPDFGVQWSDEIDAEGYPCDYPRSWRSR